MYSKFRINIVVLTLLYFMIFLLELSPSFGATVYENFDNNQYNQNLFSISASGGASVTVTNNRLEITLPAGSSSRLEAYFFSKFALTGNFDVQVDFNLLSWPAGTNVGAGFFGVIGEMDRRSFLGPQEVYYARTSDTGTASRSNTSDVSGKLRYARFGNTFKAYYWQNNDWKLIESVTEPQIGSETDYAVIGVFFTGGQLLGQEAKVAFDNLKINYNTVPLPGILLLLGP